MLSQEESQSIAEELSNRIRAYKRKRPNLSSQNIAKRFGISASTFNRIENLDIKTPTFEQIVRVLSGTGHDEDLLNYVQKNFPKLVDLLKEEGSKAQITAEESLTSFLMNPRYTRILLLVICSKGIPLDVIKKEFGNSGIDILDELIKLEFIIFKDDTYYPSVAACRLSSNLELNTNILSTMISTSFDYKGAIGRKAENYLQLQVHSLNAEKALPMIVDILRKASNDIIELTLDPDLSGNDPVFIGVCADSILNNSIQKENLLSKGVTL